jgi:hypothetical protein
MQSLTIVVGSEKAVAGLKKFWWLAAGMPFLHCLKILPELFQHSLGNKNIYCLM